MTSMTGCRRVDTPCQVNGWERHLPVRQGCRQRLSGAGIEYRHGEAYGPDGTMYPGSSEMSRSGDTGCQQGTLDDPFLASGRTQSDDAIDGAPRGRAATEQFGLGDARR